MTDAALEQILGHGSPRLAAALVLVSCLAGGWRTRQDARAWRLPPWARIGLLTAVAIGGLAGCALPAFFADDLIGALATQQWQGPKTILGGLLGGFVAAAVFKRLTGFRAVETADAFARGTCVILAVGRLGCVARHCCFGAVVPAWAGWDFGDGVPRVPVQILEALLMFLLLGVLEIAHRRDAWRNRRLFVLFLGYGLVRFGLEFLREQVAGVTLGLGFYQWLALALATVGAVQIYRSAPLAATPGTDVGALAAS